MALAGIGAASAQTKTPATAESGPQERIDRHVEKLTEKLNLTAAQQAQARTIYTNEAQSAKAIKANSGLSKDEKKTQFKSLHQQTRSKIDAILTPEQKETFAKTGHHHKAAQE